MLRSIRRAVSCSAAAAWLGLAALPVHAGAPLRDNLYGVTRVGASSAFITGGFGSIYRTSDAGKNWDRQTTDTNEHLFSVDFIDEKTGWVAGRSGTILKTVDGGASWAKLNTGSTRHLFGIEAVTATQIVAIGDWGTILVSADGGATWQDRTLQRDVILNGQAWVGAERGWIVGEGGAILRTRDGGATWEEIDAGIFKTLYGVHFRDADNGWATGLDGLILGTSDGGTTWTTLHGEADLGGLDQVGSRAGGETPHVYAIDVEGQHGVAVGDNSSVFTSGDGGKTWKFVKVPAAADLRWLRAVDVAADGAAFAVGANGLLLSVTGDGRVGLLPE